MPVLMLDLDNTLVDRAAAFAAFAADFVADHGGAAADLRWMIEADGDGFRPRETVAAEVADRFRQTDTEAVLAILRGGLVDRMRLSPEVPVALTEARRAGWRLAIVTNGTEAQQSAKLRHLRLDELVDTWGISEAAGFRKPDPRIFALAGRQLDQPLGRGWMIGDSAAADIAGGRAAGVDTVWLRRGRDWPPDQPPPTRVADSVVDAISGILAPA